MGYNSPRNIILTERSAWMSFTELMVNLSWLLTYLSSIMEFIISMYKVYNSPGYIIHVGDGWVSVQANSMELVAILKDGKTN